MISRNIGQTELQPKEWLKREVVLRTLKMREILLIALLILYGLLIVSNITIFFMQGFHYHGFVLETYLLDRIAWSTVGQVAGLLVLTIVHYLKE